VAVQRSVHYGNDRCLVAMIMLDGTHNRTHRFSATLSHYVVGDHYDRASKGSDEGKVGGLLATVFKTDEVAEIRARREDGLNDQSDNPK
jgi:hypothetical protein